MTVGGVQETITVSGETPTVNLQSTTRQAVMDQEIVTAIPSSRTPFTVGVLIPGVRKGAFTGQDVGGSVVQEVASLEANGGRTSDQRMMVNGVALSSRIAGGWGGGAVPNATGHSGVRHRRLGRRRAGGDRRRPHQLHPAGRRQPLQRHGLRAATRPRLGSRQLHRHRRAERAASRSRATSRRTATSIPASADRSSATSSGSSCPGASSSPTTTWPARSSTRTRTSSTASTTCRHRTRRSSIRSRRSTRRA